LFVCRAVACWLRLRSPQTQHDAHPSLRPLCRHIIITTTPDAHREASNAQRFAALFAFMPEVLVPAMLTDLTTRRVLVMEWIEGERLRTASRQAADAAAAAAAAAAAVVGSAGGRGTAVAAAAAAAAAQQQQQQSPEEVAENLRLVEIGVRCSLEQMLEEGFFHAVSWASFERVNAGCCC
jgi:predicted unusual protein kinase regulating ubiquinone biosynthesis (AarF/ABC1/UbiB family)